MAKNISLAVAVVAMVFTFSCSSGDEDGGVSSSSDSDNPSSSSGDVEQSSSSSSSDGDNPSSSSSDAEQNSSSSSSAVSSNGLCAGFADRTKREHHGKMKEQFCDERDGQKYVYVTINTQIWMAENLNYEVEGSMCYGNQILNLCAMWGRLYDWSMAMDLPSSCNTSACSNEIQSKHQGICPSGWHIPSDEDWDKLYRYVDGTSGTESPYRSETAGKDLKATSDWLNNSTGVPDNSNTDKYGFSALAGGSSSPGGFTLGAQEYGVWWSASKYEEPPYYDGTYARNMFAGSDIAGGGTSISDKSSLQSVRCVKD